MQKEPKTKQEAKKEVKSAEGKNDRRKNGVRKGQQ